MIVGLCNMTVHMVMYFYYFISSLGPAFKKYLWWKRHLTLLQIGQLVTIITYSIAAIWLACGFNNYILALLSLETGINLVLFLHFYFQNYGRKTMSKSLTKKIAICGSLQINNEYVDAKQEFSKGHDANNNINVENKKTI